MGKNVLIISSSMRKGNSYALAKAFEKGALKSGNSVETISLAGKTLNFCQGCFYCLSFGRCFMRDDADAIQQKMAQADAVAFATPIYYYEMSGQLKTLLDRCNPLYNSKHNIKDVYLLAAAADEEPNVPERAIEGIKGWIECFKDMRFAGSVFCGGVTDVGDIEGYGALDEAFELGEGIK